MSILNEIAVPLLISKLSFPQEIQDLLLTIYRKLSIAVTSQIQGFTGAGISTDLLGQRSSVMELWCALLIFGQWLSVTGMVHCHLN